MSRRFCGTWFCLVFWYSLKWCWTVSSQVIIHFLCTLVGRYLYTYDPDCFEFPPIVESNVRNPYTSSYIRTVITYILSRLSYVFDGIGLIRFIIEKTYLSRLCRNFYEKDFDVFFLINNKATIFFTCIRKCHIMKHVDVNLICIYSWVVDILRSYC